MNKTMTLATLRKLNDKYIRLNNLLQFNYTLFLVCKESLRKHKAIQTDDKELANKCKKAGFMVVLDFDKKTYVIAEV